MDYWEECIAQALEDAGIEASKDQLDIVVKWVEGAHDTYGMAFGHDAIPDPVETQAQEDLRELRKSISYHDDWVASTDPCRACATTGHVNDGWGRNQRCIKCDGDGRVRRR